MTISTYKVLYSEKTLNVLLNSPFLMILPRVIPANQSRKHYQTTLPKEKNYYICVFLLQPSGHSLTVCGTEICSMTIHPITAETVIIIYS